MIRCTKFSKIVFEVILLYDGPIENCLVFGFLKLKLEPLLYMTLLFFLTETIKGLILNRLCTAIHYRKKEDSESSCSSKKEETKLVQKDD